MKRLILVFVLTLICFSTLLQQVQAAWWNPLTWGKTEVPSLPKTIDNDLLKRIQELESKINNTPKVEKEILKQEPEVKTITKTVQDPALQARLNILVEENARLKKEIADLQVRLSSLTVNSGALNNNLEKIRAINVKLAELDQLDHQIDNYKPEFVLEALNNAKTIEGARLFNADSIPGAITKGSGLFSFAPIDQYPFFHRVIDGYRQELKVKLSGLK
ncbi:MAG: hypothetical protein AAB364_00070 [Patescibacteria group bacterium]